jgi:lysophospholipase L1-like esterase
MQTNTSTYGNNGVALTVRGDSSGHDIVDFNTQYGTPAFYIDGNNYNAWFGGVLTNMALNAGIDQWGTVSGVKFVGNGANITNLQSTNIAGPYFTNIQVEADSLTTNLQQWNEIGSAGIYSIQSNVLAIAGQNNTGYVDAFGDCLLNTNFGDPFHWSTMSFTLRVLQTNTSCGFGFGYYSQGQVASNSLFFALNVTPTGGYNGTIGVWWGGQTIANQPTDGAAPLGPIFGTSSFPTNTPFGVTLVRRDENYYLTFSNQVSGAVWSWSYSVQSITGGSVNEPSAWEYPAFWANYTIVANVSNFKYTIDTFYPVQVLLVGDSITSGFGAANPEDLWSHRLMRAYQCGVDIDAGGGGTSQDMTNWVAAKYLHPSNIVEMIGVNDLAYGVAISTTEKNIATYWGINSNYCAHFLQAMPVPWVGGNLSSLALWIQTNYPAASVVDFYDSLVTSSSYTLTTNCSYDGVHPNAEGQGIMFDLVNNKINGHLAAP